MSLWSSREYMDQYPFPGWDWYVDWSCLYIFAFTVPVVCVLFAAASCVSTYRMRAHCAATHPALLRLHQHRWFPPVAKPSTASFSSSSSSVIDDEKLPGPLTVPPPLEWSLELTPDSHGHGWV